MEAFDRGFINQEFDIKKVELLSEELVEALIKDFKWSGRESRGRRELRKLILICGENFTNDWTCLPSLTLPLKLTLNTCEHG